MAAISALRRWPCPLGFQTKNHPIVPQVSAAWQSPTPRLGLPLLEGFLGLFLDRRKDERLHHNQVAGLTCRSLQTPELVLCARGAARGDSHLRERHGRPGWGVGRHSAIFLYAESIYFAPQFPAASG